MTAPTFELVERRRVKADAVPRLLGVARGRNLFYPAQGLPSTGTPSAGVLALAPLFIDRVCVLKALAGDVTTIGTTGAVLRLALYADDGTRTFPGALVADAGTIDATVAGPITLTLAAAIPLTPGLYWIGGASQGTPGTPPVVRTISNNGAITMPLTSNAVTNFNLGASMAAVTGACPAAFSTSVGYTGVVPRVAAQLN